MSVALICAAVVAVVGAIAFRRTRTAIGTSPLPAPARRRVRRRRGPIETDNVEHAVRLGTRFADSAHNLLLPLLRRATAARLRRHGVDLDADPQQAARLAGEDLIALLQRDRPDRAARLGPGVPTEELDRHLRRLEEL